MYLVTLGAVRLGNPPSTRSLGKPYTPPITKGGQFISEGDADKILTILSGPSPYQSYIQPVVTAHRSQLPKRLLRIVYSVKEVPKHLQGRFSTGDGTAVGGTIDRAKGTIYLLPPPGRRSDTRLEFALHEAVHLFAHPFMTVIDDQSFRRTYRRTCGADETVGTFQRTFCTGLGEGMTQLITEQIMAAQGISKTTSERPYKQFTPLAAAIVSIFSLETCARAYFLGEVNELILRMEFRWGPGWQNVANYSTNAPRMALDEIKALEKAFYERMRDYPDQSQVKRYASLACTDTARISLGNFAFAKTTPDTPRFTLDCGATPPPGAQSLKTTLREGIRRAIILARSAADRLESPTLAPQTTSAFLSVFGEDTAKAWPASDRPTKSTQAGQVVASRLRTIARELETRDTLYRCVSGASCAQGRSPSGPSGTREPGATGHPTDTDVVDHVAVARLCRNEVWLCPAFWIMQPEWQAGTLIHEMLHLCFGLTCAWFQHDSKERKKNSAYCYEAFALVVNGQSPEPITIQGCHQTPV
jgi:hypothetical protein